MNEETEFYSDATGARVTDKRVILGNTTYSMANITSVSTSVEQPSRTGPILFMAIGVLFVIGGMANLSAVAAIFGGILAAIGAIWYKGCKPVWHLKVASASGEQTPLRSIHESRITGIANAINTAIVRRT
ncbi:MAG: DUF6232 family protein [Candidatus Acidiferrales bacterium]